MPNLSDTPFEDRLEIAFVAYLSGITAFATWIAAQAGRSLIFRAYGDPRDYALPAIIVRVANLRQSWPGSDEFEGQLIIGLEVLRDENNASENPLTDTAATQRLANQTDLRTLAALIEAAITDQSTIRTKLNVGAGRTSGVDDLHFYSLADLSPDTQLVVEDGGCNWLKTWQRRLVCARVDYAAA